MAAAEVEMPEETLPMRLKGDPDDPRFWLAGAYRAMNQNPKVWTKDRVKQFEKVLHTCGPDEAIDLVNKYFHVE